MNKFNKALVSVGLAATLAVGGQVATADNNKAEAYTTSSCYWVKQTGMVYGQMVYSCWYDFSWWEEVFQRKRDGRYYEPYKTYA